MPSEIRALELAIAHGDTADVAKMVEDKPTLVSVRFPENLGLTPLMWACRNRHTSIVEFLLSHGAGVNDRNSTENNGDGGNTALWFTAQGAFPGTVPIARLLFEHNAEVNARCEHGTTAFFMAVTWVHMELVQLLLKHGADPSIPNSDGRSPLEAIQRSYEWLETQETKTEDMKRLGFRAPRMIAFLQQIKNG
ncbi:MAG: ankyrin repeat domain-containing protein [Candidatus Paceibacterota bacterium]|jgi:hypothetical protein